MMTLRSKYMGEVSPLFSLNCPNFTAWTSRSFRTTARSSESAILPHAALHIRARGTPDTIKDDGSARHSAEERQNKGLNTGSFGFRSCCFTALNERLTPLTPPRDQRSDSEDRRSPALLWSCAADCAALGFPCRLLWWSSLAGQDEEEAAAGVQLHCAWRRISGALSAADQGLLRPAGEEDPVCPLCFCTTKTPTPKRPETS
ncbi:hypothetical protein SRHO_G00104720 [Serrasalmus rhombeus]